VKRLLYGIRWQLPGIEVPREKPRKKPIRGRALLTCLTAASFKIFLVGTFAGILVSTPLSVSAGMSAQRTIIDPVGRQMEVPVDPRRVVALAPSVTEVIFALGRQGQLKGVTRFSDFPPQARHLPQVGSYVHLDIERIVALQPDLCIGIKDGNPLAVVVQLKALGIPVFAVDPVDLESTMQSIRAIGSLLGVEKRAGAIVSDMQRRIDRVTETVARAQVEPVVFVQIGVSPIVSAGSNTFINELITRAGGINAAAGRIPYPRFSREQVIALAPEVMVISSMARSTVFERVKAEWMQWPSIPAVRDGALFIAPSNVFDRPSPRLVDGLELMARYIHPHLFQGVP
jgi:iron complex transport system substrate-binding protein